MIGGRKSRSNKGKKRTPYGPRSRTRSGAKFRGSKVAKKVFRNNVSNVNNIAPVIRTGTNIRPTFNTMNKAQRKRKVRSNKGKKRGPYGPHSRTRSGKKFKVRGGGPKPSSTRAKSTSSRTLGRTLDRKLKKVSTKAKSTKKAKLAKFAANLTKAKQKRSYATMNPAFRASVTTLMDKNKGVPEETVIDYQIKENELIKLSNKGIVHDLDTQLGNLAENYGLKV